jgi:hypothetical protein
MLFDTAEPLGIATGLAPKPATNALYFQKCPISLHLTPETIRAKFGEPVEIRISIANRSDSAVEVYNPKLVWSFHSHRALMLAISSEDGDLIGDLLVKPGGPNVMLHEQAWTMFPPGETGDVKSKFQAGHVHSVFDGPPDELLPGKYILQLRAFGHLVCGRPDLSSLENGFHSQIARLFATDPLNPLFAPDPFNRSLRHKKEELVAPESRQSYFEWESDFPGPEICRSNRVELEILPRTGE